MFLLAAALGVHAGEPTQNVDERDYDQLAHALVAGQGYRDAGGSLTAYRPPGYPFVLAAIYEVRDSRVAARLVNAAFLAGAAFVLGLLAARLRPGAQVLVPLGVLAFPLSAFTASLRYPQALSALLIGAVIALVCAPRPRTGTVFLAGLLYGFLCLAVPSFVLLAPVVGLAAGLCPRDGAWFHFPRAIAMTVGVVLVIAPWTARNTAVLGAPVPVSTNSGINLLLGNSPATRPDSGVNVPVETLCPQPDGSTEVERDRGWRACATTWMRAHPADAATLYVGKLAYWFSPTNTLATGKTPALYDWILRLTYIPLLLLALVRLALFRSFPLARSEAVIYSLYFIAAVTGALFFSRIRFRVPFDLLLIPVVAGFLLESAVRRWPGLRATLQ